MSKPPGPMTLLPIYLHAISASLSIASDPTERPDMRRAAEATAEHYEMLVARMRGQEQRKGEGGHVAH